MKAVLRGGYYCLALMLLAASMAGALHASLDYAEGPGTVEYALARPDGAPVSLTMVVIGRVNSSGVLVHEWWDKTHPIPVLLDPTGLFVGQTLDIEGKMTTLPSGSRAVLCSRFALYLDSHGSVAPGVPPLKGLFDPSVWPSRGWVEATRAPLLSGIYGGMSALEEIEPPGPIGDPPPSTMVFAPGTIPWAKSHVDGTVFGSGQGQLQPLVGKIVTAGTDQFSDCIYIEESDRSSGIMVEPPTGVFAIGDRVSLTGGAMRTSADGERYIEAAVLSLVDHPGPLSAVGMPNRDIGGTALADGQAVFQRGVAGASGTNNIGLLVRAWGTVTAVYPAENCLYMDDGSALNDTTHTDSEDNCVLGVRVSWDWNADEGAQDELALVEKGARLMVTGISSTEQLDDPAQSLIRVLRPRTGIGADVLFDDPEYCDWPMFMHDQHHTGRSPIPDLGGVGPGNTITMTLVWTAEVPTLDGLRPRYGASSLPTNHRGHGEIGPANNVDHPIFDSSPVVKIWSQAGEIMKRVFVGGFDGTYAQSTGRLYCFDFAGTKLWTYPASGQSALSGGVASTPAVAWVDTTTGRDLRVFFGSANGILYAVSAVSGELRWQYDTEAMILASPVVSKGVVYIGNEMNELVAVNAATGQPVFTTILNQYAQDGITGTSSPIVAEVDGIDYVFVTSDDSHAYKVYAAGEAQEGVIAARYPDPDPQQLGPCLESSPSFKDEIVYFGDTCCIPETYYNMHGLDVTTFGLYWNGWTANEVRTTPALCADGVYVGDETGTFLYHFDFSAEPDAADLLDTCGHVFSSQALTSGLAFCGNDLGRFQALRLTDFSESPGNKLVLYGAEQEIIEYVGGHISSSPAICYTCDDGVWRRWVFITSRNCVVYEEENEIEVPSMLHAFCSQP